MAGYSTLHLEKEPGPQPTGPVRTGIAAFITLGQGVDFGIADMTDGTKRLIMQDAVTSIDLGPATKARINAMCSCLLQMRTFCD